MLHRRSLAVCLSLALLLAVAATAGAEPPKDPLGVVTIKKGQPVHVAYWLVVAGGDASLGIDIRRGVEIAIQDKGGKLLGLPI
jgi:branched-chain amino acid transport system substrate-binding protein